MMTEEQRRLYELALSEGKRRFGSPCKHETVRNGICVVCLRRVLTKTDLYYTPRRRG